VSELRAKFVGGPRDKKTRGVKGVFPAVIDCPADCKFHNVYGRYVRRGVPGADVLVQVYDWIGDSMTPGVPRAELPTIESIFGNRPA